MRTNSKSTRKAGRPSYKPTAAQRRRVSIAAGGGMYHDEIATALGISRNTLEKYFAGELNQVAFQRRMEVLEAQHRSAMKGNVAAQKSYLGKAPANPIPEAPGEERAPAPVGKKEAADLAAVGAERGTKWDAVLGSKSVQ